MTVDKGLSVSRGKTRTSLLIPHLGGTAIELAGGSSPRLPLQALARHCTPPGRLANPRSAPVCLPISLA